MSLYDHNVSGAEIRFRFRVASDRRDAARAAAEELKVRWLDAGAETVKLECETIVETQSRAPEVARAKSLPDKLEAYWRAREFDPGERRDPLLEKLAQLQDEAAA
jgi:hypothetical protein